MKNKEIIPIPFGRLDEEGRRAFTGDHPEWEERHSQEQQAHFTAVKALYSFNEGGEWRPPRGCTEVEAKHAYWMSKEDLAYYLDNRAEVAKVAADWCFYQVDRHVKRTANMENNDEINFNDAAISLRYIGIHPETWNQRPPRTIKSVDGNGHWQQRADAVATVAMTLELDIPVKDLPVLVLDKINEVRQKAGLSEFVVVADSDKPDEGYIPWGSRQDIENRRRARPSVVKVRLRMPVGNLRWMNVEILEETQDRNPQVLVRDGKRITSVTEEQARAWAARNTDPSKSSAAIRGSLGGKRKASKSPILINEVLTDSSGAYSEEDKQGALREACARAAVEMAGLQEGGRIKVRAIHLGDVFAKAANVPTYLQRDRMRQNPSFRPTPSLLKKRGKVPVDSRGRISTLALETTRTMQLYFPNSEMLLGQTTKIGERLQKGSIEDARYYLQDRKYLLNRSVELARIFQELDISEYFSVLTQHFHWFRRYLPIILWWLHAIWDVFRPLLG